MKSRDDVGDLLDDVDEEGLSSSRGLDGFRLDQTLDVGSVELMDRVLSCCWIDGTDEFL